MSVRLRKPSHEFRSNKITLEFEAPFSSASEITFFWSSLAGLGNSFRELTNSGRVVLAGGGGWVVGGGWVAGGGWRGQGGGCGVQGGGWVVGGGWWVQGGGWWVQGGGCRVVAGVGIQE